MKSSAQSSALQSRVVRAQPPKKKPVAVLVPPPAAKGTAKAARSQCPINLALEMVGDSWSLLIIRDLMLRGHTGYQAFLRSEEKIATNILADRLLRLEQNGLISKSADPADARKFIYALTVKGADLAPLLVEMALFSDKYAAPVDMPNEVLFDMRRNKQGFVRRLIRHTAPRTCLRAVHSGDEAVPVEETLSLF